MKINTNTWNKIRYTIYAPIYDLIAKIFKASRKKSIDSIDIKPNEKILIVGAGTGLDLEFINNNCEIVATDITVSMLEKLKQRNLSLQKNVTAIVMDGQALQFPNETFDKIILHLILAVIPDPIACIKEVERVLKPDGQVAIFDKFIRAKTKPSIVRHIANLFTNLLFSNITRDVETIVSNTQLKIVSNIDADFNGNFRIIKLIKSN